MLLFKYPVRPELVEGRSVSQPLVVSLSNHEPRAPHCHLSVAPNPGMIARNDISNTMRSPPLSGQRGQSRYYRPEISPSEETSMSRALGREGKPGRVSIRPASAYKKPAPTEARMSVMGKV